jgi:hypothetical protein
MGGGDIVERHLAEIHVGVSRCGVVYPFGANEGAGILAKPLELKSGLR